MTPATLWRLEAPLVLASGSMARRRLLADSGVPFEVDPADLDETAISGTLRDEGADAAEVASALASGKALRVSARRPDRLVLGGDQTLALGTRLLEKPGTLDRTRAQLVDLSGRTHLLVSAAALARNGALVWSGADRALMTMRVLSPDFLDLYLRAAGPDIAASVGGYHVEGLGLNLFASIEGAQSTIMGLPLLALLAALRAEGALAG